MNLMLIIIKWKTLYNKIYRDVTQKEHSQIKFKSESVLILYINNKNWINIKSFTY